MLNITIIIILWLNLFSADHLFSLQPLNLGLFDIIIWYHITINIIAKYIISFAASGSGGFISSLPCPTVASGWHHHPTHIITIQHQINLDWTWVWGSLPSTITSLKTLTRVEITTTYTQPLSLEPVDIKGMFYNGQSLIILFISIMRMFSWRTLCS